MIKKLCKTFVFIFCILSFIFSLLSLININNGCNKYEYKCKANWFTNLNNNTNNDSCFISIVNSTNNFTDSCPTSQQNCGVDKVFKCYTKHFTTGSVLCSPTTVCYNTAYFVTFILFLVIFIVTFFLSIYVVYLKIKNKRRYNILQNHGFEDNTIILE